MSALTLFYPALRILLMDYDASVQQYPNGVLDDAIRTVILMGQVPTYTLTPDTNNIQPDIKSPTDYALLTFRAFKLFISVRPDRYAFKTRGFSEAFGSWEKVLTTVEMEIHNIENGVMFSGWQSYFSWLHGVSGLPLGEVLANFNLAAPLWEATFTRDGMKVA